MTMPSRQPRQIVAFAVDNTVNAARIQEMADDTVQAETYYCALPERIDSKMSEETEWNAKHLATDRSSYGMLLKQEFKLLGGDPT